MRPHWLLAIGVVALVLALALSRAWAMQGVSTVSLSNGKVSDAGAAAFIHANYGI